MSRKMAFALIGLLILANITAATAPGIVGGLNSLCANVRQILPVVALLMFFMAGAIYAAGQVMGAETRARANVWSTSMLVGGIIGLIIAASAKYLLQLFATMSLGTSTLDTAGVTC